MADLDLGKIYGQVAKALGNKKTALYVRAEGAADAVEIVVQAPPALVVGPALAGEAATPAEIRFQIARGIELTRPEYILAAGVRPKQFTALFASVLKAFHPAARQAARHHRRHRRRAGRQAEEERPLQGLEAAGRAVPGPGDDLLELPALALGGAPDRQPHRPGPLRRSRHRRPDRDSRRRRAARRRRPVRHARGDPPASPSRNEPVRELLRFAVSDDYFYLREKLGTAIAKAAARLRPRRAASQRRRAPAQCRPASGGGRSRR